MNTNMQCVCYIRRKQVSTNRWIGKIAEKIPTGNLKTHLRRSLCVVNKDSTFP